MEATPTSPPYLNAEFDEFFRATLEEWKVPGGSLAVIESDKIYTKVHGVTRVNGPKVTEDTLFNVASMSKSFTASAVALLVDDEAYPEVKWDTPVCELMRDDFVLPDPYLTQNVTVMDMLRHRTGMIEAEEVSLGEDAKDPSTPQSIVRSLRHLHITRPLRAEFWYNNLMYTAASYLVEKVAGKSFSDVLKERFWEPLGMHRTLLGVKNFPSSVLRDPENKANIAVGCRWVKEEEAYVELHDTLAREGQGAGNILSSAKEYGLWVQANILGSHAVSKESLEELTRPRVLCTDQDIEPLHSPIFYGMGWNVQYYRGYKMVSHSGGVPGFTSQMIWLPEQKWGAVLLGNSRGIDEASTVIIPTLIDDVLGVSKSERADWTQIRRDRVKQEKAEAAEEAVKVFEDRANPSLPLPLPLSAYAGRYTNPAYHDFIFEIKDNDKLFAEAPDRTFAFTLTLEHVSSNFFVAVKHDGFDEMEEDLRLEAEFEVGVNGKVERLGIDFIDEDWSDYSWFTKVD